MKFAAGFKPRNLVFPHFQLNSSLIVLTAIIAGLLSVVLALWIPGNSYIVLASVTAATVGLGIGKLSRAFQAGKGD